MNCVWDSGIKLPTSHLACEGLDLWIISIISALKRGSSRFLTIDGAVATIPVITYHTIPSMTRYEVRRYIHTNCYVTYIQLTYLL